MLHTSVWLVAAAASHLQLVQLLLYLGVMLEVAELEATTAVGAGAALCVALLRVKPAGPTQSLAQLLYKQLTAGVLQAPLRLMLVCDAAGRTEGLTGLLAVPSERGRQFCLSACCAVGCCVLGTDASSSSVHEPMHPGSFAHHL
jgi:hypothetical protein